MRESQKGRGAKRVKHGVIINGKLVWHPAVKMGEIFLLGGVGYGLIELLWRGRTHPSMVLTGGACLAIIYGVNSLWRERPILLRCGVCALLITAVEFCVGLFVNRLWHMDVWDYSREAFHLMGQVCPKYTFLWFLLSVPLSMLLSRVIVKNR